MVIHPEKSCIDTVENVTGRKVLVVDGPRRAGDLGLLVADSTKVRNQLGWKPDFSDLEAIVQHAWAWECKR